MSRESRRRALKYWDGAAQSVAATSELYVGLSARGITTNYRLPKAAELVALLPLDSARRSRAHGVSLMNETIVDLLVLLPGPNAPASRPSCQLPLLSIVC